IDKLRIIRMPEAAPAQAIALLEPYGQRLSPQVALSHDAARRLVELLAAFRRDTAFPGKALAFLDYLATRPARPTALSLTELAKQLARYLFGDAERLVRVDMSELVTGAAIARLITPSPAGTSLADRIRRQPLSVVLFDEIEKADAAAFDLLLGVVGEGRLT